MAGCSNCGSDRLDLTTTDPINKVFCHDCGAYQPHLSPDDLPKDEPEPGKASLSEARADIEAAFHAWACFSHAKYDKAGFTAACEAEHRVAAFLAQCEDPAAIAVMLHDCLAGLKPGSRLDVFDAVTSGYCIHCGDAVTDVCHCTNDD